MTLIAFNSTIRLFTIDNTINDMTMVRSRIKKPQWGWGFKSYYLHTF